MYFVTSLPPAVRVQILVVENVNAAWYYYVKYIIAHGAVLRTVLSCAQYSVVCGIPNA